MKVIGAGFGRTGTASLKSAIEALGFDPCYHRTEVFRRPEHANFWEAAWRVLVFGTFTIPPWQIAEQIVLRSTFYGRVEEKEGWGSLCEFLGVEEPEKPFPRLNDAVEMRP